MEVLKDAGGHVVAPEFLIELVWDVTWPWDLVVLSTNGVERLDCGAFVFSENIDNSEQAKHTCSSSLAVTAL